MNNVKNEINRLNFEDIIWIVFAVLCLINISGDYNEKEYLKSNNNRYKNAANKIFEFTLFMTLLIYIYFLIRNYKAYKNTTEEQKELYTIKLFGSIFLIVGIICLIYFQSKQTNFNDSPAL